MSEDMRGLFFIVKGQHKKGLEPSFTNKATGDVSYIGGYNPYDTNTEEWYMLLDSKTFYCLACGSDLKKVLRGVYTAIKKYKGVAKKYFKHISDTTSDDYYEVTYLGHKPLTHDGYEKKAHGRCPRVSPATRCLYERIYKEYGDFFSEEISEMEDLAYMELIDEKPINKSRKLVSKNKTKGLVKTVIKEEKVIDTSTPKKLAKPKIKFGVKKLPRI